MESKEYLEKPNGEMFVAPTIWMMKVSKVLQKMLPAYFTERLPPQKLNDMSTSDKN